MPRPVSNPPNPWESTHVEWLGPPPEARLEVFEERAKSALTRNDSDDIPFRFGLNPYRGCQHACAYCYARRTHELLGFGAGTDFDKKIVVKTNLPELLGRELARPSWRGEPIMFSGVTDCYQPLEASYRLTRGCLERCREHLNPVAVVTKSSLIRRDLDLLADLAERAGARVYVSIPFARSEVARLIEPGAPTPADRFATLRALSEAGVPCGLALSPLVPGLNESDVPELLARAREAGATSAFMTLLRLPGSVRAEFGRRLEAALPDRAGRILSGLGEMRGEDARADRFGERMRGRGARWDVVADLFAVQCRRLGLETTGEEELRPLVPARAAAPRSGPRGQGLLFGDAG
jgi:DNA repair photolyase